MSEAVDPTSPEGATAELGPAATPPEDAAAQAPLATDPPPVPPTDAATPRKRTGVFKVAKDRSGKQAEGKILAELRPAIERGDVIALRLKLEETLSPASQLKKAASDKLVYLGPAGAQLKASIAEASYQGAALAAATLAVEAAFLGDPLVTKAEEILALSPFLEKATKGKKSSDALALGQDLEGRLTEFAATVAERADGLAKVGDALLKTLAKKDFLGLAALADGVARDAALLALVRGSAAIAESSGDQALAAQSALEKWVVIDKQVLQLNQSLLAGQYLFAVELAKMVATAAGVMGDPALAKAVELTKGSRQLLDAFRAQKVDLVGRMGTTLAKQCAVFNSPLMARASQLADQCGQWEKARKDKDTVKMAQLASAMARTAALLVDPTIRRASLLAGDIPKVEVYIKRRDFASAVNTLDAALK